MVTRYRRRSRVKRLILPLITVCFAAYFGYHAFNGDYGILARAHLVAETEILTERLDALKAERANLEAHVKLLRDESIDRDLADERARALAGLVRDDELVILLPNSRPASSASLVDPSAVNSAILATHN